jgi:hypothetical protein
MSGKCSLPECGYKDGLACELGHIDFADCPHFSLSNEATVEDESAKTEPAIGHRLPWSGRALGLSDMMLVSGRSPTRLVGLIGPFNAGKTSFLTSLFTHLAKTAIVNESAFAGSYSVDAWAQLKRYTQWPATTGPSFPPHTPDTGERVPSLLHLAFRKGQGQIKDVLFTDAPGEWFTRWVLNQHAESASGARWVAEHATNYVLVVDRSALAGEEIGQTRHNTLTLARLIAEYRGRRAVGVIWTKSDLPNEPLVEDPLRQRLEEVLGPHASWNLDVKAPDCLKVLEWVLDDAKPSVELSILDGPESASAFMAFKGVPA